MQFFLKMKILKVSMLQVWRLIMRLANRCVDAAL